MKSLQLFVPVRVSVLLFSAWLVAMVAGSGDADVDPVITDLLSGATLENNSFVNPSQNNTIELRCAVYSLGGEPRWVRNGQNQLGPDVSNENMTFSDLRVTENAPSLLEGLYCCEVRDGHELQDSIVKCVQVTKQPLKGPQDVTLTVDSFAVLSDHSVDSQAVPVPRQVGLNITCSYSSDTFPPPTVSWYIADKLMSDSGPYILDEPMLSTSYHCVVENQVGSVSSVKALVLPIDALRVRVSPEFAHLSEEDSQVTLNCSYESEFSQTVDYYWLRQGEEDAALSTSNLLTLQRSDALGSYFCVVTSSFHVSRIAAATVAVAQLATLQIVVDDLVTCGYTNTPDLATIGSLLQETLINVINSSCGCSFTENNIRSSNFQCYPDGLRAGVYRADITYNATGLDNNIDNITSSLWQWVQVGRSVVLGNRRYPLSTTCAVKISSSDDKLCTLRQDLPFVITLELIYSFAVGVGTAFVIFVFMLLLCCCLVKSRHVGQMRKERRRRNAPERRPMIELVNVQGTQPPEPLDPALSVRTTTSWSSNNIKDQAASKNSLSGSRESIRSEADEVVRAAREMSQGRKQHMTDRSPDSGLMPSNHYPGSTQSLNNGYGSGGMSASLEELADNLHQPTLESAADGYFFPVSRSLQHIRDSARPSSLPNSPHALPRTGGKSEHFTMTATDEMLTLIEEVRAAKEAFQQILEHTPQGSPIMGRPLERTPQRTQSFREPAPYRRGNHRDQLRSSDPNFQPMPVRRTNSGDSKHHPPPATAADGSTLSMNAFWAEKLRASNVKRNVPPESPPMHQRSDSGGEYDCLEPRTPPTNVSCTRHRSDRNGHQVMSPLAKNQMGISPHDASGDSFPPPPTEALRSEGQMAGGPVFVPGPLAPTAAPLLPTYHHTALSSSQPALDTAGKGPAIPPPPPPPPPPPSNTPPIIPPKVRRGANPNPHPVAQPGAERSPQCSHEADLKEAIRKMQRAKAGHPVVHFAGGQ